MAASASAPNHDYLLSLGAELAVDYRNPAWPEQIRQWGQGGVDAAVAVQPDTSADSQGVVRDGGRVVTISGDQITPIAACAWRCSPTRSTCETSWCSS